MPIRRHHRWLYPIDWRELSAAIRFRRAKGRCEGCGRPHGRVVVHLGDGRWWDDERYVWRDGSGKALRRLPPPHSVVLPMRGTRVVLATAHRDHDPTNNDGANRALQRTGEAAAPVAWALRAWMSPIERCRKVLVSPRETVGWQRGWQA